MSWRQMGDYLRRRFVEELPLWRLSLVQFCLLLLWSAWPTLARWAFPDFEALALVPVMIFYPFVYVIGYPLVLAFAPGIPAEAGGALAIGITVFVLAYLGLVSWRQARMRTRQAKIITNILGVIALLALVVVLVRVWS